MICHPIFGIALRAMRLGYRWSEFHACYVRVSEEFGGRWRIDLAPRHAIAKTAVGAHACWWDDPSILAECPYLEQIREGLYAVTAPETIIVDEDGRVVE